jgi:uncharacterized tellurite resistance protein B-like protein
MLSRLKNLLDPAGATAADPTAARRKLELATAALLVEVMRSDGVAETERAAVEAVGRRFGLAGDEARSLVAEAEAEVRDAVGYYPFTSLINRHFSAEDKERIVELLWQVAYVDATLSAHEQHVIRKVADLLHLSHAAYVGAKLRAKDAAGHK